MFHELHDGGPHHECGDLAARKWSFYRSIAKWIETGISVGNDLNPLIESDNGDDGARDAMLFDEGWEFVFEKGGDVGERWKIDGWGL